MAMNSIRTALRNTLCDALVDAIDAGTTDATGDIQIGDTGFATVLAELAFSNPAFDDAGSAGGNSDGVATANAIADDTSAVAGTAAECRVRDRDNNVLFEGTAGEGSEDLVLNNATFLTDDVVSITAATVTMPAG